jgi:peptidoglycan/LPS O-acetylase OafA/YrhL
MPVAVTSLEGRRFGALDSLRGVCAAIVAAYHFNPLGESLFVSLLGNAYLFVDFFFVLSGFVIAHGYGDAIRSAGSLGDFIGRRLARLYPLHVAAILPFLLVEVLKLMAGGATGLSEAFSGRTSAEALAGNLFLLHGLGAYPMLTWNGPSWSISCEFWTYILFGLVVLAIGRSTAIFGGLALAGAVALFFLAPLTMNVTYDYGLLRCIYGFFVGAATYAAYERLRSMPASARAATALETGVLAAAVLFVMLAGGNRVSLLAPLVFAAVTLVFAFERGAWSGMLGLSGFRRLGQLSYGIYMLHAFAIYAALTALKQLESIGIRLVKTQWHEGAERLFIDLGSPLAMDVAAVAFIGVIVVAAEFSFRWIEEPGRRAGMAAIRRIFRRAQLAR